MSLQLIIVAGPDVGRVFTLQAGPQLMLGRSQHSFYQLKDPRASRNQCQLLMEGEHITVIDSSSSAGTFVNGRRITRHTLKLGDILKVGDTELRLHMGDFPLADALGAVAQAPPPAEPVPAPAVDKLEALSGTKLGHYEIGPVIGTGRSAMVFHASDERDNRSVALKVLLPEFSKDDEEMQRFVRAMKTMLTLKHPNLVTVYGAGKTGRYCWVAMEYIAGENMTQVIARIGKSGMLDWRYGHKVALHVARALACAHAHQIVHRNITPTNVLLDAPSQTVKLADVMLAKALGDAITEAISRTGQVLGDVSYLSPEATRGIAGVDVRSDLYGLGATVYALLAGRPPFEGSTLIEQITRIRQSEPDKLGKYQRSIPRPFESLVLKLLAKRPEDRYQTAVQLMAELEKMGEAEGAAV
jgi:serine/threonine protein kinase